MKKIFFLFLIVLAAACGKYTTPGKVERKIVKGSWNMFEFIDNGNSLMETYNGIALSFSEGGEIATTSENKVKGTWSVGSDRNPALLYMTFPDETDSMHVLSDDWVVYKLTNDECILKRNMGNSFDYDASLDGLILRKVIE